MEPKKPYFEVVLLGGAKTRNRKKITIILATFAILIAVLVICVTLIHVLSPAIKSHNYFYVYIKTDAINAGEAEEIANDYRVRGGAGITVQINGVWCVVLSLYKNESDANTVVTQLSAQDITAGVEKITTPTPSVANMNDAQIDIAQNIYDHYLQTIETLYDISVSLDENAMTESTAQVRVKQLALLWQQRTQDLAGQIGVSGSDSMTHPLIDVYTISLQITGLLDVLASENSYTVNLITYMSLVRETTFQLAEITL